MYHTLGQRQGLGIGGVKNQEEAPWYVARKDLDKNVLIVVQGNQHPLLFSNQLTTADISWVSLKEPDLPLQCYAKVRYRQLDQACILVKESSKYRVIFDDAQRSVTPGQFIVFYQDDICLGGGVIETSHMV